MATAKELLHLFVLILLFGYTAYYLRDTFFVAKAQRDYENEFLRHHHETILRMQDNSIANEVIRLSFPPAISENLTHLCLQYRSLFSPLHYVDRIMLPNNRPSRQLQYLRLRRVAAGITLKSVPLEIIRCSEKYAVIDAPRNGHGIFGYVLQKDDLYESADDLTVFYIVGKFEVRDGRRTLDRGRGRQLLPVVRRPTSLPIRAPSSSGNWGNEKLYR